MNVADKQNMQIKQLIFHNLMQIVEQFPQYTIAQHFSHVLRRKTDSQPSYNWNDEKTLKKFEDYKDELETELANTPVEIDD